MTGIRLLHLLGKDYIYFCGNVIGYESGSHPAGKAAGTKAFPLLKPRQPSYSLPSRPLPFNSCLLSVPQGQQTKPLRKLCYFWTHTSLLWQVSYFMAILLPITRGTERKRKEQFFPSLLPLPVPDLQQREQMRSYSYLTDDGYLRYLLSKNSLEVIHYLPGTTEKKNRSGVTYCTQKRNP